MICVSLADLNFAACRKALESVECAEIRLDKTRFSREEIAVLFALKPVLIATCRPGPFTLDQRREKLATAITAGASYVDIEFDAEKTFREYLTDIARKNECCVIMSYHNFKETPSPGFLQQILEDCFSRGADIAKIACQVDSQRDCARLLSLYDTDRKIIALGMGNRGRITRMAAPLLGAPFTYAASVPGHETAEGQFDKDKLENLLKILNNG